jgi:hypothetical protein
MGNALLGTQLLNVPDGFTPLVLPESAIAATAPSSRTLAAGEGNRLAVDGSESIDQLLKIGSETEDIVLMGLSSDGEQVAELTLKQGEGHGVITEGSTSIWLSDHGVTVFNGSEWAPGGDANCTTHSLCAAEDGSIDLSNLSALATGEGPIRLGTIGEATVSKVLPMVQAMATAREGRDLQLVASMDYEIRNDDLTNVALWLGGLPLLDGSQPPGGDAWSSHAGRLEEAWNRFDEKTLEPSRGWGSKHLSELPSSTLFYPFSGPDIANGVNFFPNRSLYILAGLEAIGTLQQAPGEGDIEQGLKSLRRAISTILGVNFFRTKEMSGEYGGNRLGSNLYNGTGAILYVFLSRTGHDLISARHVTLSEEGSVVAAEGNEGGPAAVEIVFRKHSDLVPSPHPAQTMIYFSGDISDEYMGDTRGMVKYFEAQGEMVTFLKAASYLMYRRSFDDIRRTILSRSSHIITEASGVPYHFLAKDTENWDVKLYGEYRAPIAMFGSFCQPDLKEDIVKKRAGDLTFRYGYSSVRSHLILASRKTPLVPVVLDKSNRKGTSTTFYGNGEACIDGRQEISVRE